MNFNEMVNSGYFCYMAEAEGLDDLVSTRTAKANAVIREAREQARLLGGASVNLYSICARHGLTDLTDKERRYIETGVNR